MNTNTNLHNSTTSIDTTSTVTELTTYCESCLDAGSFTPSTHVGIDGDPLCFTCWEIDCDRP